MTQELELCPFCGSPFDVTNYGYFDTIISCSGQLCPLNKGMGTDFTILDTPEHRALLNIRHTEPDWLQQKDKEKA